MLSGIKEKRLSSATELSLVIRFNRISVYRRNCDLTWPLEHLSPKSSPYPKSPASTHNNNKQKNNVFAQNKHCFCQNTTVFTQNTTVFALKKTYLPKIQLQWPKIHCICPKYYCIFQNTTVFTQNTIVFAQNTTVFAKKKCIRPKYHCICPKFNSRSLALIALALFLVWLHLIKHQLNYDIIEVSATF